MIGAKALKCTIFIGWQMFRFGIFSPANKVHNKVISGFEALRQARAPVAGLEPATEGSLQISGRTRKPLCYRRPK
ncbi:hypothetical protein PoB_002831400 [Plakobranchus ocellatus]|uniref:Uncharacterized protein n=1 Tax=Plakobranchus ocellatus TaxID=259542 RepID=A0AAV4A5E5_9GAST|nr:hypothetical protein PoB_002831400 [Plakobranchus ocellatus]